MQRLRFELDKLYEATPDPWDYRHTDFEHARRQLIVRLMPDYPDTILDIGCSEGWITDWIKAKEVMSDVYGIDISDVAVSRATERYPLINFRTVAFGQDPLPRNFPKKYDVIVATDVLYYGTTAERDQMVKEIVRLLKPNGRLIVSVSPKHNQAEICRLKKCFEIEESQKISHLTWVARLRPKALDIRRPKAPKTLRRSGRLPRRRRGNG